MFGLFLLVSGLCFVLYIDMPYAIDMYTGVGVAITTVMLSLYFNLIFSFYMSCVEMLRHIGEEVGAEALVLWTFLPLFLNAIIKIDNPDFSYLWYLATMSIMLTVIPVILIVDNKDKIMCMLNRDNSNFMHTYNNGEKLNSKLIKNIDSIIGMHYEASLYTNIPLYCATSNIIKIFYTDASKIMYNKNIQEILEESYRVVSYYKNKSRQHLLGCIVRSKIYINKNRNRNNSEFFHDNFLLLNRALNTCVTHKQRVCIIQDLLTYRMHVSKSIYE
jgi:hypothetical protein